MRKSPLAQRMTGMAALLCLMIIGQGAKAQFFGTLVYQLDRQNTRLVMTYTQSGTNVRITAYDITLKNGVPDSTTIFPQDTILFDLAGATETHLQYRTGRAIKAKYTGTIYAQMMPNGMKGASQSALRAPDSGQVNGYNAAHYQVIEKSQLGTGTRDIWITHDLGPAPAIWVIGSYLYYTPGLPTFARLINAGANGLVVKTQSTHSRLGLQYTMNLVSVQNKRRISPTTFTVPSWYTQIDNSNMPIPPVSQ